MYYGGSVVGKASYIDPQISPNPPPVVTGGVQKCEIWSRFQHHSTLSRPRLKMHQSIQTLKQVSTHLCLAKFGEVGSTYRDITYQHQKR